MSDVIRRRASGEGEGKIFAPFEKASSKTDPRRFPPWEEVALLELSSSDVSIAAGRFLSCPLPFAGEVVTLSLSFPTAEISPKVKLSSS